MAVGQDLAERLGAHEVTCEVLDATAAPVRDAMRSGSGWPAFHPIRRFLLTTPRQPNTGATFAPSLRDPVRGNPRVAWW